MDRQLIINFLVFLVCASIYAEDVLPPPKKYPYYRRANRSTCAFPFVYKGKTYHDCTTDGDISADFPWCSLHSVFQGAVTYCHDFRNADLQCLPSFTVNGKQYTSCDYITKISKYKQCQSNSTALKFSICVQEHIPARGKPTQLTTQCDSKYRNLSVNHTMCIQPSDSALSVPLTDAEKTSVVAKHNDYRNQVNAKVMMKLYWDDELAKIAQAHSDMCAFEHDIAPNRVSPLYGWFHGQNLVMTTDIITPLVNLVDIMFSSEQARYTYGVPCTVDNSCSHYTQMMLATLTRMGCGHTHCLYPHGVERFLVCNYIHSQYDDTAVKPYEEVHSQDGNICPASKRDRNLCDCGNVVCGDDTVRILLPGCTCPNQKSKRSTNERDARSATINENHKPFDISSIEKKRDLKAVERHSLIKRNPKFRKVD